MPVAPEFQALQAAKTVCEAGTSSQGTNSFVEVANLRENGKCYLALFRNLHMTWSLQGLSWFQSINPTQETKRLSKKQNVFDELVMRLILLKFNDSLSLWAHMIYIIDYLYFILKEMLRHLAISCNLAEANRAKLQAYTEEGEAANSSRRWFDLRDLC